jgi:anti-sigma regulatory factor (Ser/Thr protein kinase)
MVTLFIMNADTLFNLGFAHWQAFFLSFVPALITLAAIIYFWNFPFNTINKVYLLCIIGIFGWQLNDSLSRLSGSIETAQSWNRLLSFAYLMQFPSWLHCVLLLTGKNKVANNHSFIILIYFTTLVFAIFLSSGLYSQSYMYSSFWGWMRTFDMTETLQTVALSWVSVLIFSSVAILGHFAYTKRSVPETKSISLFMFLAYATPVVLIFTIEIIFPLFFKLDPIPLSATVMVTVVIILSQLIRYKIFDLSDTFKSERIAEIMQESIFVVSPQRCISYINPYALSKIGRQNGEIKKLQDVFAFSEGIYTAFEKQVIFPAFEKRKLTRCQFSMNDSSDKEVTLDITTYPIFNRKNVDGLLVICRDITDQINMAETKLAALRSQMNPHFIFNSLNSIQHYIHSNQREVAESFLSTFAVLMRKILDNSANAFIPLSDELITIELYLKLEKARFGNRLNYKIIVDESISTEDILIPSMLIQPYLENAILHGLTPKDEGGSIIIQLSKQPNYITCTIEDNGIGRKKALEIKNRRLIHNKSHGMSITKARLEILNQQLNVPVAVKFSNLYNGEEIASGTLVEINIPVQERF